MKDEDDILNIIDFLLLLWLVSTYCEIHETTT